MKNTITSTTFRSCIGIAMIVGFGLAVHATEIPKGISPAPVAPQTLQVYPNPFDSYVDVKYFPTGAVPLSPVITVKLVNSADPTIILLVPGTYNQVVHIQTTSLPPGVYALQVCDQQGRSLARTTVRCLHR